MSGNKTFDQRLIQAAKDKALGDELSRRGQAWMAFTLYNRLVETLEEIYGKNSPELVLPYFHVFSSAASCCQTISGRAAYRRALTIMRSELDCIDEDQFGEAAVLEAYAARLECEGKELDALPIKFHANLIRQ